MCKLDLAHGSSFKLHLKTPFANIFFASTPVWANLQTSCHEQHLPRLTSEGFSRTIKVLFNVYDESLVSGISYLMCAADCLLACCVSTELALCAPAKTRTPIQMSLVCNLIIICIPPVLVSGLPQLVPPIQTPWRRKRRRKRKEWGEGRGIERCCDWEWQKQRKW